MGQVAVQWVEGHLMVGADSKGQTLVIGRAPEQTPEWVGLKPSDLLLLSAAACAAYDVVMILKKQREPLLDLTVTCDGTQQPDPPYAFTALHLHYRARGAVALEKLARAIALSEEKYCSVVNTLKASVAITHDYEIVA